MRKILSIGLLVLSCISVACNLPQRTSSDNSATTSPSPSSTASDDSTGLKTEPPKIATKSTLNGNKLKTIVDNYVRAKSQLDADRKKNPNADTKPYKREASKYIEDINREFGSFAADVKKNPKYESDSNIKEKLGDCDGLVQRLSNFTIPNENYSAALKSLEEGQFIKKIQDIEAEINKPQSGQPPSPSLKDYEKLSLWIAELQLWILVSFATSILAIGIIGLLLFRKSSSLKTELDNLRGTVNVLTKTLSSNTENLSASISNCEMAIRNFRSSLPPDLTDDLYNLKLQIQSLHSQPSNSTPTNKHTNNPPQVPTVRYFLNQIGNNFVRANTAFMRGDTLTQDGDGKFALLPLRQNGQYYAIPFYERFGSAQDFSHYQRFYQCDQPSAGEIIVVDPAIVDFDANSREWNLRKRGVLQVNA
jgi:hypothetical protein